MSEVRGRVLWWLCLFVAPATPLGIELYHPAGFTQDPGMYQYLSRPEPYNPQFHGLGYFGPHWWFVLHMIQTPMIALVAVGLWMLAGKVRLPRWIGPDGDTPDARTICFTPNCFALERCA